MNDNVTFGLGCKSCYFFLCAFANLIGYKDVPTSSLVDFGTLCLPAYHTILSFILILIFQPGHRFCCILDSMLVWDLDLSF